VSIFEGWPTKQEETWFKAGVNAERERIIKLLKDQGKCGEDDCFCDAIKLIEGEQDGD
jgi:ArsR family metal-binding transcriptional regulator